jgi:hypothetical protein
MKAAIHSSYGAGFSLLMFGHWCAGAANIALALWFSWIDRNRFEIRHDGALYLTRYRIMRNRWFRLFVHNIHLPDEDRHPHNHPWPTAFSIILRGGYSEFTDCSREWMTRLLSWRRYHYNAGDVAAAAFGPDMYHRITFVKPNTWTLFIAGRRTREWGFLVQGEHVDYRVYLNLPADHKLED